MLKLKEVIEKKQRQYEIVTTSDDGESSLNVIFKFVEDEWCYMLNGTTGRLTIVETKAVLKLQEMLNKTL